MNPVLGSVGPDLNDPAVLATHCIDCAAGLEQQAVASRAGSAMGGAPFPDQFYRRCAALLNLCAEKFRAQKATQPPAPVAQTEALGDMGSPPRPKPGK